MAIASLSFSAAVPVYNSIGSNGTIFGGNSLAVKGDVAINTNGAPASSGNATVLTSDLLSNGLSYTPQSSFVSGNQLTVYYNLSGNDDANGATDASAAQTLQAGDQGAALAGGLYGNGITITPEGSQTNGNITTTAYEISLNGPVNNTVGTVNQQTGYSISNSSDGSSLSLQNISSLGNGLKVTYQLSDATPSNTEQATPATAPNTGNTGHAAAPTGTTTIGDLLAGANGLSFNGTLTDALQAKAQNQSTGASSSASILASVLSANSNTTPGTPPQVTDFIDTSSGTLSTSAPADQSSTSSNNDSSSGSSDNQGGPPSGVYTAFADVGASTIRGSNLNVVA